jgi:formate-nitrite transporter family protein
VDSKKDGAGEAGAPTIPALLKEPPTDDAAGKSNDGGPSQPSDDLHSRPTASGEQHRSDAAHDDSPGRNKREAEDIEELSSPPAPVIYEVIRKHGTEEMERPGLSLWWSGLAAGVSISFSLLAQAVLKNHLPDEDWTPLVTGLGYSVGFMIVILGRQQLFTENTITAVLPFLATPSVGKLGRVARLWGIVLAANTIGTLLAALLFAVTPMVTADTTESMLEIARKLMSNDRSQLFFTAVASGFLIAAMVWMIPTAETAQFWVILLLTWLIGANELSHIIAGSTEVWMLVIEGEASVVDYFVDFFLPTLAGNIVGGTVLFAVLSHAQVAKEM